MYKKKKLKQTNASAHRSLTVQLMWFILAAEQLTMQSVYCIYRETRLQKRSIMECVCTDCGSWEYCRCVWSVPSPILSLSVHYWSSCCTVVQSSWVLFDVFLCRTCSKTYASRWFATQRILVRVCNTRETLNYIQRTRRIANRRRIF